MGLRRTRKAKAWLLSWEWTGAHVALEDQVAAILPARWSRSRVEQAMWLLYHARNSNLAELADLARSNQNVTLRPQWDNDVAHLGSHPWMVAVRVTDLFVETQSETGVETLHYVMEPIYRAKPDSSPPKLEIVREPLACAITRTRTGALSWRRVG